MKNIKVVIGANFGDEGKGLMTDYFASKSNKSLVVRFNGGGQAGHTVTTKDGRRHVFHHFGSGIFAGADTSEPTKSPLESLYKYLEFAIAAISVIFATGMLLFSSNKFDTLCNSPETNLRTPSATALISALKPP